MSTFIRLTDYKSSDEKEEGFFKAENRYIAKQEDFEKIPGSPIAYWVSDRVNEIFETSEFLSNIANPKIGMRTGDNNKYLRFWFEISSSLFGIGFNNKDDALVTGCKWLPYNKGGDFRKWYGNNEIVINWFNDGFEIKTETLLKYPQLDWNNLGWKISNESYFFNEGITWSAVSSSSFGVRYTKKGFLFDVGGSSAFPQKEILFYILSFLSSKLTFDFLKIVAPTINFQVGDLKALPIIFPKYETTKQTIDTLTQQCIDISKEEWDSRETSWDFTCNALLKHNEDGNLEKAYAIYCAYWAEKFKTLHVNEEELNRLFIEIYELQDELTPDVALGDITILKNEKTIENGKLVFKVDEIIKQFISYGVGVLFGRYSLDHEGLHVANMRQNLDEANASFNISIPSFEVDEDNIIPVLEDDYFKDDITARFIQFVKVAFGEASLHVNIRFIENALGMSLRKYFVKGFYEDHIKRYKKRPIYWMVSSPKKGFMSLSYMHRYESDLFGRVRNSYLGEYITKLEAHKESLEHTINSSSATDKDKKDADKRIKEIEVKLKELIAFDREKMMHFAQQHTDIDLDDGVKVNYTKFQDILFPIAGLSDEEK